MGRAPGDRVGAVVNDTALIVILSIGNLVLALVNVALAAVRTKWMRELRDRRKDE